MFNNNTNREWEKIGATDPYFGVCSHDQYRLSNLKEENKEKLFISGSDHINNILNNIKKHIDPAYTPKKAVDFGCGVGRMVIPLAKIAKSVVGLDISESMLNEAKKNCENQSIKNASFFKADENLSALNDKYDFIHSFIVFQHIPVKRGERLFENLLTHLEDGGICVVHFTYARHQVPIRKLIPLIKNYIPLAKYFINLIKGRGFFSLEMQMNAYNLNKLLFIIQKNNAHNLYAEYTNHGGNSGILLYFRKAKED